MTLLPAAVIIINVHHITQPGKEKQPQRQFAPGISKHTQVVSLSGISRYKQTDSEPPFCTEFLLKQLQPSFHTLVPADLWFLVRVYLFVT